MAQKLPAVKYAAEAAEEIIMQYTNQQYDNAEVTARAMSDQELIDTHLEYMKRDRSNADGVTPNLIDVPLWTMVKWVARQRGVDLNAAWENSIISRARL